MGDGPPLWLCFTFTVLHLTLGIWGALRFDSLITFCQASNKSDRYPYIKTALLLLLYVYAPLVVVSITLMWVAYDQNWPVGYFFMVFPYFSVVGFVFTILMSHNDISNFVDVHRSARAKLPVQTLPPPLVVGVAPPIALAGGTFNNGGGSSPSRFSAVRIPPALPVRDGNVVDDDDAF